MPIQSSGTISLTDIVNEFGGSVPHSLSEYYRGGGAVPSSASSVPASGAISLNNFYSAANAIGLTIDSETTNYQTSTAFGSNWAANVPKTLTIPSGVTVGSENANAALIIDSGMGGTLIVHNSGSIQGSRGEGSESGAGGAGGPAVQANQNGNVTFNNNAGGEVYAGGGGGGVGGTGGTGGSGGAGGAGGTGKYLVTYHTSARFSNVSYCSGYCCSNPGTGAIGTYLQTIAQTSCYGPSNGTGSYINHSSDQTVQAQSTRGRFRYYHAQFVLSFPAHAVGGSGGSGGAGGAGGVGGAGGKGKGYKQTRTDGKAGGNAAPGSAGAGGAGGDHPNAGYGGDGGNGGIGGAGGAGGNGGTWGTAGSAGATGSTGGSGTTGTTGGTAIEENQRYSGFSNRNVGSAGASGNGGNAGSGGFAGGAAGAYVVNRGYITFNNSGSVAGT